VRALVTGAMGFIGGALCARLVADGWDVVAVDKLYAEYAEQPPWLLSVDFEELDLVEARLDGLGRGVDVCFHLAGRGGVTRSLSDPGSYVRDNVVATARLLEECASSGVGRFVLASTSSVYGHGLQRGSRETDEPRPLNPYARTKLAAEQIALARNDLDVVVLRYFTVYGPGQREDMCFQRWCRAALTGGRIRVRPAARAFTYVDDAATGTVLAAERGRRGKTYNIGREVTVPVKHALTALALAAETKLNVTEEPLAEGEARQTRCDASAARLDLGWRAETQLGIGLRKQLRSLE